jgi:hypothetical protein
MPAEKVFGIRSKGLYHREKPVRDPLYRRFVKGFPCVVCKKTWGIDLAHTGPHGYGQKSSDLSCIALCRAHHDEYDANPVQFAETHQIDVSELVAQYQALWSERKKAA